jgi:RNA polymerase sigma-70 factor, ECF subfamily
VSANETVSARIVPWSTAADADWDALYAEQLPRVYNFFRYRVGCTADAEDLTARTFEKAWRSRHRYQRDIAAFSTWLLTIARHVAIDYFRARRVNAPVEAAHDVAAANPTPEQRVRANEDARRLECLLQDLPPREREILAMKYGAEMTNRAIARATGLTESNVGTIVQRTLQRMRAAWDEHRSDRK